MQRRALLAVAAFVGSICFAEPALADKRVALLIGNAHYAAVSTLNNPANDVAAMANALQKSGFTTVHAATDLSRDGMIKALRSFEDEAANADIAMIYYSGHGMEMNGTDYLVPIDAKLISDRDVEDETITLDRALRAIEGAKRLKLVILDACRDNPFLPKMAKTTSTRSVSRGFARIEPSTVNTLIAFSAKAGEVAQDGDGPNSPFTTALVKHIVEPGVDIRIALGEVRDDVMASTGNTQEPFVNGSLGGGTIALSALQANAANEGIATSASSPPHEAFGLDPRVSEAAIVWPTLAHSDDISLLAAFRQRYAGTIFEDMAAHRIIALSAPPSLPANIPKNAGSQIAVSTPDQPADSPERVASVGPVPPSVTIIEKDALGPVPVDGSLALATSFRSLDSAEDISWGLGESTSALHFMDNGNRLLAGGWKANLRVWDLKTGTLVSSRSLVSKSDDDRFQLESFADGGNKLVVSNYVYIHVWDFKKIKRIKSFQVHGNSINYATPADNGTLLTSSTAASFPVSSLRLWNVDTGKLIWEFGIKNEELRSSTQTQDGSLAAADLHGLTVFDVKKRKVILNMPDEDVSALKFSPDGKELAVAGKQPAIIDPRTGAIVAKLPADAGVPLAFSPDGTLLALSSSGDHAALILVNAQTGEERSRIDLPAHVSGKNSPVISAEFRDATLVAVGHGNSAIVDLVDVVKAALVSRLVGLGSKDFAVIEGNTIKSTDNAKSMLTTPDAARIQWKLSTEAAISP
ncbi:caspase family protein [Labrys monachus]|uniref:WD40 repeat protein n=1 Tax=Labrys monachus TaxID=217067 RepID=A0ABU0F872_9HYPH|nr:caspase family protein [Labrys monachus]MDQ0390572.1 WD40 repeat protein [Labrys monachus]